MNNDLYREVRVMSYLVGAVAAISALVSLCDYLTGVSTWKVAAIAAAALFLLGTVFDNEFILKQILIEKWKLMKERKYRLSLEMKIKETNDSPIVFDEEKIEQPAWYQHSN